MKLFNRLSRRAVLAGQAALTGLVAMPALACSRGLSDKVGCADAGTACVPPDWRTATAEELRGLVGDRFRVSTPDDGDLVLKLAALEPGHSGPARPADLPRRESVVAIFESPDMAPLVARGDATVRIYHPRIGSANFYAQAVPRHTGGHFIEVVLN